MSVIADTDRIAKIYGDVIFFRVTGMTAQWFSKAIKISEVGVERIIVNNALQWLSKKQFSDGSFRESSTLPIDDPLQQNPVTLTALTLQTFLETRV